jgi:hypothetical protein
MTSESATKSEAIARVGVRNACSMMPPGSGR